VEFFFAAGNCNRFNNSPALAEIQCEESGSLSNQSIDPSRALIGRSERAAS